MPNFSKEGDYFIRKGGDDVTGDGSNTNPWATFSKLSETTYTTNDVLIVGDGVYLEEMILSRCDLIYADGDVLLEGASLDSAISCTSNVINIVNGFHFRNFSNGVIRTGNNTVAKLINCYFDNCGTTFEISSSFTISTDFTGSIFKNGSGQSYTNNCDGIVRNFTVINDDISLNARSGNTFKLINTYFDSQSILRIPNSSRCLIISNCNIEGQIEIDGVLYGDLASATIAHPSLIQNCISQDPLFNPDYSVNPLSPNLSFSSNGTFIGAKGLGISFNSTLEESRNNIDEAAGVYTLSSGATTGTITFQGIDLGADYILNTAFLNGTEDYFNNEVVDSDILLVEPNQRTIEFKFCTQAEIISAGSLNAALALKPWQHFIRNRELSLDGSGNPNYDANYDPLSEQPIVAGAVQCRLTLRNNGIQS